MASLSNTFYDYARLSKYLRQRVGYKGVKVITFQESEYGQPGYVAPDTTVEVIAPAIIYPDLYEGLDLPGKTGGAKIDGSNSLTYSNAILPIGPKMEVNTFTVPVYTKGVAADTVFTVKNTNPSLTGVAGVLSLFVISRYVDNTQVAKLEDGDITLTINGSAATPSFGWEGGALITKDITIAASQTFTFGVTFAASGVVAADYEFYAKIEVDGQIQVEALEVTTLENA